MVEVRPNGTTGWSFTAETGDPVGELVDGPADPPLGSGSAEFELDQSRDGLTLFRNAYQRTRLDEMERLRYCTYVETAPGLQAVALQLNADYDLTDGDNSWQGRLVFEPSNNDAVQQDTWQCWLASERGAEWWATGGAGAGFAPQSDPQTLQDILKEFPDAGVHGKYEWILLKAGSGWPQFTGYADAPTIHARSHTTFDFEGPGGTDRSAAGRPVFRPGYVRDLAGDDPRGGKAVTNLEAELTRRGEESVWAPIYSVWMEVDPREAFISGTVVDVTARKEVWKRLEAYTYRDPLTELPNRRYLEEQTETSRARARLHDERVVLLYLDLS